jgi:biotin carboxylase
LHVVFVESNLAGLQAFEAAKKMGCFVSFIYSPRNSFLYGGNMNHPAFLFVDRLIPVADVTSIELLTCALQKLSMERPIDAALTVSEFCVLPVCLAAESLGIRCTRAQAVQTVKQKAFVRKILAEKNIEDVKYTVLGPNTQEKWLYYPAIIKPNSGAASMYAKIIHSPAELLEAMSVIETERAESRPDLVNQVLDNGFVIEELLPGRMLSVETFIAGDQYHVLTIGQRLRWDANEVVELGTTMPANLSVDEFNAVESHVHKICAALNFLRAIVHIELILTDKGPLIVEINPRLMGGSLPLLYEKVHGVSVYQLLISTHLDRPIGTSMPKAKLVGVSRLFGATDANQFMPYRGLEEVFAKVPVGVELKFFISAGAKIPKLNSNNDYIGQIIATASDAMVAQELANQTLNIVATQLGVKLAQ